MEITNRELLNKVQVLSVLSNKQLPVKVSYALAKNINSINKELKIYEEEKLKIAKECSLKDESGNPKIDNNQYVLIEDKKEVFSEQVNELLDIEIDLPIRQVNVNELLNSSVEFSPAELMELDFMLVE